jgi:anti-sigma factor ChrR (cupin superfamily)
MLKCRDIAAHASDRLDGQLSWRQSLGYGVHLLVCGHCRQFLRHLRTTITYTRALPEQAPLPEAETQAIVARVLDPAPDSIAPHP